MPRYSRCVVGFMLASVAACENTQEGVKQDTEALQLHTEQAAQQAVKRAEDAKSEVAREIAKFKASAGAELDAAGEKLTRLRAQAGQEKRDVEQGAARSIEELDAKRRELARQLDGLNDASAQRWQQTKQDLHDGIAKLGRQIDAALDDVGDSVREATQ